MSKPASENLYTSSSGWYTFAYPESWTRTDEDDCVTICDSKNGLGALQVSAYRAPEPQDPTDLLFDYLTDNAVVSKEGSTRCYESEGNHGAVSDYVSDDGFFFRVWFIAKKELFLLVTYSCRNEHREAELDTVDRIVHSIALAEPV